MVDREGEELIWDGRRTALDRVDALHERFDPWTGQARLVLRGTGWKLPIEPGYGEARARLRRWLPDVPFQSDWMDGRFPGMPMGLPPSMALALGLTVAATLGTVCAVQLGWWAGLAVALLAVWPLGRLRDGWVVRTDGIRGGPPWAPVVPWYEIDAVVVNVVGRRAWLFTRGRGGGQATSIPTVLLPALRARVRRLGGLELVEGDEGLDDRYLRWRAPAVGIPWGVGLGTVLGAWWTPLPWTTLVVGALVMSGTALLGLMVTLRSRGWGFGSVVAGTLLYALLLLAIALAGGGWIWSS